MGVKRELKRKETQINKNVFFIGKPYLKLKIEKIQSKEEKKKNKKEEKRMKRMKEK